MEQPNSELYTKGNNPERNFHFRRVHDSAIFYDMFTPDIGVIDQILRHSVNLDNRPFK